LIIELLKLIIFDHLIVLKSVFADINDNLSFSLLYFFYLLSLPPPVQPPIDRRPRHNNAGGWHTEQVGGGAQACTVETVYHDD